MEIIRKLADRAAKPGRPGPDKRVDAKTAVAVDIAIDMLARRSIGFIARFLSCADVPEHVAERVLCGSLPKRQPR